MDSPLKVFPAHEQKFYKLFHDFIDTFNSFDENLSICLGLIISGGQRHLAYPVIEKLSTNEKIDSLKQILNSKEFEDKKNVVDNFNRWVSDALKIKCIRNNYVHARWQILVRNDSYQFIHCRPINLTGPSKSSFLTVNEFEEMVSNTKRVLNEFGEIYKEHLCPYTGGRVMPKINNLTQTPTHDSTQIQNAPTKKNKKED